MALTDSTQSLAAPVALAPRQALARLPEIHAQTSETLRLAQFLGAAVTAGAVLLVLACLALIFAGGAGLKQEFSWSLLLLAGIGAMIRSYIRSIAQEFDRTPLREAAKDLRTILFYLGFAWGAGSFLLLGNDPVPLVGLCYAMLPSLLLPPLLRDRVGGLNFVMPVTALTAASIVLEPWGNAPVALILLLIVQGSIVAGLVLSGRTRARIPAGLSLG